MGVLNKLQLFQYSLLALPLAFAGLPIYIHAPDFYAVGLGLSLASIGFMLLALRFIDAVQDPIIGYLSDKYEYNRPKIVILGMAMLALGFVLLFNPPASLPTSLAKLAWMGVSVFICTTGFSIVTINMQTLGSLWHSDNKQTLRIMSWREAMGLIGLLIGSILPPILLLTYAPNDAYAYLSFLFIPLIIISGIVFLRWQKSTKFSAAPNTEPLSMRAILKNKSVLNLYLIFIISAIATAIPATLVLFFIRDYLQAENFTGLFLLLYFLSGVIAMPAWQAIADRKSAAWAWFVSMILACLVFVGAFFLTAGDIVGFAIICILSGAAVGGDLVLPPTLISALIQKNKHQKIASQYYAISAFSSKSALAIATGIALPLLAFYGYVPGTVTTQNYLPIAYALIPCGIKLFSALLLWQFIRTQNLNRK